MKKHIKGHVRMEIEFESIFEDREIVRSFTFGDVDSGLKYCTALIVKKMGAYKSIFLAIVSVYDNRDRLLAKAYIDQNDVHEAVLRGKKEIEPIGLS